MQRSWLSTTIVLLLLNTVGTVWLVVNRGTSAAPHQVLTDSQLAQMEKLFRIMTDFHNEVGTVTGQAAYESDEERTGGKQALQAESIAYSLSKLDYGAARRSRTVHDLQEFVSGALYPRGAFGTATMDVPSFQRWVTPKFDEASHKVAGGNTVTYANVAKLESLDEQFKVLAQSLIEDIK